MANTEVLGSNPSPDEIRSRLEQMVINDLLGPAAGAHEEITEANVRDRYLVGVLGPSRPAEAAGTGGGGAGAASRTGADADNRTGADASGRAGAGEVEVQVEVEVEVQVEVDDDIPLIPDELSEGGADVLDDGTTDQDAPLAFARLPSSFGMTFSVAGEARRLRVSAAWGQYLKVKKDDGDENPQVRPARITKRHPRGGTAEIELKEGLVKPIAIDPDSPEVYVQGRIRRRNGSFVVTMFLVNGQQERRPKDEVHLFQPQLAVEAPDGAAIFERRVARGVSNYLDPATRLEEQTTAMLYRRDVEFAVGHGVSVHATVLQESPYRAVRIQTEVIPTHEVPRSTPPTAADAGLDAAFAGLAGLVLDMRTLAELPAADLQRALSPLVDAYRQWIDGQAGRLQEPGEDLSRHRKAAEAAIAGCRQALERIDDGITLLAEDAAAFDAFRFMNRAMWLQHTHSIYSERVRRGDQPDFEREIDVEPNRRWCPFQIAFILLNIRGVTKLDHADRSADQTAVADLLFFPTGGGKTEAYLGLTAYTLGLRRLQGAVEDRSGENGVAVLMRYTLRLLTIQQFQRAAALICACEVIRQEAAEKGEPRWGATPFRIGLWVGRRTTPNRTDDAAEAIKQARSNRGGPPGGGAGIGTPYQLTACPWCGAHISAGAHLDARPYKQGTCRTLTYCGDKLGRCPFSRKQAPDEGIPVVVVDEEIYRRLPALLIPGWLRPTRLLRRLPRASHPQGPDRRRRPRRGAQGHRGDTEQAGE